MDIEATKKYIKAAMDCIDELEFSDNALLAFYNLRNALEILAKTK